MGSLETKQEVLDGMSEDLKLRNYSVSTQRDYLFIVRRFQNYFDKPASQMGAEEVREYLLHLVEEKCLKPSTLNTYNCAIRFLFSVTFDMPLNSAKVPFSKSIPSIPNILTRDEVQAMFDACDNLRDKSILMVTYSAGLRLSETAKLRVKDIDSLKMRLFIEKIP